MVYFVTVDNIPSVYQCGKNCTNVMYIKGACLTFYMSSWKNYLFVASMLFGMFFGAGNIIFPVHLGQAAGSNVWPAIGGFILTGVGIPILAKKVCVNSR